jgi:hypothetical protein
MNTFLTLGILVLLTCILATLGEIARVLRAQQDLLRELVDALTPPPPDPDLMDLEDF